MVFAFMGTKVGIYCKPRFSDNKEKRNSFAGQTSRTTFSSCRFPGKRTELRSVLVICPANELPEQKFLSFPRQIRRTELGATRQPGKRAEFG
jgi:hypothetical protein